MSQPSLPTTSLAEIGTLAVSAVPGDYRYLDEVVRIGLPVHDARTYLKRHLGNPVQYRLVEGRRGERIGCVREVEVQAHAGGDTVRVRAVRTLPDGSPASYFAPQEMVSVVSQVTTDEGGAVPSLHPRDRIVLHVPVRSYMRFLPGLYSGSVPTRRRDIVRADERSMRRWGARESEVDSTEPTKVDAGQFQRFLFLFQHLMTTITDEIDDIPKLTDPLQARSDFLPWISSWINFELDGSLPLHQQRELVRRSIRLTRTRGTQGGIEEMIRVLTSAPVRVVERKKPQPCVLGGMTLAGGRNVEERYLGDEPPPHYLVLPDRKETTFFVLMIEPRNGFAHRFGERATTVLRRIVQIVTNERPSHVVFTIQFEEPA